MHVDLIPDLGMLILGEDLGGVADLAPNHILQRLIAVEAATPLPDLSDPRPDRFRRRSDVEAKCVRPLRVRNEFVAGKWIGRLGLLRAPAQTIPSQERSRDEIPCNEGNALESSKKPNAGEMCACRYESFLRQFEWPVFHSGCERLQRVITSHPPDYQARGRY